jgi:hypothetical protein
LQDEKYGNRQWSGDFSCFLILEPMRNIMDQIINIGTNNSLNGLIEINQTVEKIKIKSVECLAVLSEKEVDSDEHGRVLIADN